MESATTFRHSGRTLGRRLRHAAETFIAWKARCAAGHRFEVMPTYLMTEPGVAPKRACDCYAA